MRRLRVGFDATGLASAKPPTGLERYSHALLNQLAALRDDEHLELFLYLPGPVKRDKWDLDALAPDETLHWRTAPIARGWYRALMGATMLLDRIDVMHFPAPHMSHYCPAPSVVTVHDLAAMSLEEALTKKERHYLADAHHVGRRASALIAVSASAGTEIERFFGRRDYEIIHEGADQEQFRPASPAEIAELHAEYDLPPYVLCVGTLQARKNHLRLIDAFESIEHRIPHTLALVGRDGSGAEAIHERLEKRPNPRIRLLGYLPEARLPVLYSGATALVLPSLWEGFGLPILEAMACDTPVLTSNISSLVEVAGEAALTVDPRSVDDIAEKLYCLLSDEKLREALRQRGRVRVKEFSWHENARQTIEVYRRTAAPGQRRQQAR